MMKSVLILMFMLTGLNVSAQNRERASVVMEVQTFLSSLRGSDTNGRSANTAAAHLESLINDNPSAVYFNANGARTYGDGPISLYTNPTALANLRQANFAKDKIEIVTIRLNTEADKNSILDLSVFSDFPNLKYVYILSDVKTTGDAISRSVKNISAALSVFYKIEVGS